jgi:DNA-binding CsgD family transcriptional regulator
MSHAARRAHRPGSTALAGSESLPVAPDRVLQVFAAADLDAFIDAVLAVLEAAVMCEFASTFSVTGPDGLLKERDSRGREYSPEFMRRYVELSPAIPVALAHPGVQMILTREDLAGPENALRETAFYREIMKPQGWRHAVALCFWDDVPARLPVFVASVNRTQAQGDFTDRDLEVLRGVYPLIDCAARLLRERDAAKAAQDGMTMAINGGTPGHAILSGNLALIEATPVARRLCAAWNDGVDSPNGRALAAWRAPSALLAACRELHRDWQSFLRADPVTGIRLRRRLSHERIAGLTASVTIVGPTPHGLAKPIFMLEFDRRVHGIALDEPDDANPVLRTMTPSERAVAMVLADGLSNQEIADRLGKTVSAVKFLLHRIYRKTGVPNRAALVAVLRQQREPLRQVTGPD